MSHKVDNYLRRHRRRLAFTHKELIFLLGYRAHSSGPRFERQKRRITLINAFSYSLIFNVEPKDLFPALYLRARKDVVDRMQELQSMLGAKRQSKTTVAKLRLLEQALSRVATTPNL